MKSHLHARDYAGEEPAIVLLHGFPDNQHLYDRLVPELVRRRVVTFDFLGWGRSDKPAGYTYTASNQTGDLDAVALQLASVVLVAHDASGPPVIDWALEHPERVSGLVLLNTDYWRMPGRLRPRRRSGCSPPRSSVGQPVRCRCGWVGWCFAACTGGRWGASSGRGVGAQFIPQLYEQFTVSPTAHEAFLGLIIEASPSMGQVSCSPPSPRSWRPPQPRPVGPHGLHRLPGPAAAVHHPDGHDDQRRRWVFGTGYDPRHASPEDFTDDRVAELVRAAAGLPEVAVALRPQIPGTDLKVLEFPIAAHIADSFRADRVFLVGDAAHAWPPTGGLGANTGIQDATTWPASPPRWSRAPPGPGCWTPTIRSDARPGGSR